MRVSKLFEATTGSAAKEKRHQPQRASALYC